MQEMEHPFYSLSKKPVTTIREYRHGDHWLKITPGVQGLIRAKKPTHASVSTATNF